MRRVCSLFGGKTASQQNAVKIKSMGKTEKKKEGKTFLLIKCMMGSFPTVQEKDHHSDCTA